jgi:hypothetical protein
LPTCFMSRRSSKFQRWRLSITTSRGRDRLAPQDHLSPLLYHLWPPNRRSTRGGQPIPVAVATHHPAVVARPALGRTVLRATGFRLPLRGWRIVVAPPLRGRGSSSQQNTAYDGHVGVLS